MKLISITHFFFFVIELISITPRHGFLAIDKNRRELACGWYRKGSDCFARNISHIKWNWQFIMTDRSDDMANDLRQERKSFSQIEKAGDSVKREYRLLKEGKQAMEEALGETFKLIVNLLKRLITATNTSAWEIENLIPKKDEVKTNKLPVLKLHMMKPREKMMDLPSCQKALLVSTNIFICSTWIEKSFSIKFTAFTDRQIVHWWLEIYPQVSRPKTCKWQQVYVERWLAWTSLQETDLISSEDKNKYGKTLQATNAYKKVYIPDEVIQKQSSNEYNTYMAPFISVTLTWKKASLGKGLPQYKIAKRDTRMNNGYCDELVHILRRLLAERSAGNSSEIVSIIEELRKAWIV